MLHENAGFATLPHTAQIPESCMKSPALYYAGKLRKESLKIPMPRQNQWGSYLFLFGLAFAARFACTAFLCAALFAFLLGFFSGWVRFIVALVSASMLMRGLATFFFFKKSRKPI
jgi:hypothetical protein